MHSTVEVEPYNAVNYKMERMKQNVYSEQCSPIAQATHLETVEDEDDDDDVDLISKSLNSSIADARLPSYSVGSSMNTSSLLAFNDINDAMNMNENIQFAWNSIEEIRGTYLRDIKNEMNQFKNALSLWNEGGFIPLFSNFMSWINEADQEMKNMMNRLTSNTTYIQRFVKLYKKQQISLQYKTKQIKDLQFENNEIKKENEWLRNQMLMLSNTISTSHQEIKSLNDKHDDNERSLIEKLEKLENMQNDEDHNIEGVIIFESPKKQKRIRNTGNRNRGNRNMVSKSLHIARSTSVRTCKKDHKYGNKAQSKVVISNVRSRSHRTGKVKTPRVCNKNRRNTNSNMSKGNPLNISSLSNVSCSLEKENTPNMKLLRPSFIPKPPKTRKSLSGVSIIRKPRASLRRLSYAQTSNNS